MAFPLTGQYNAQTRQLSVTDTAVGDLALRRLVLVEGAGRLALTEALPLATLTYTFSQDGVYQVAMQRVDEDGLVLDESAPYTHAEDGSQRRAFAELYLRHAANPAVRGHDNAYRAAWLRGYLFLAAVAERNPARYRALAASQSLPSLAPSAPAPYVQPQPATAPGLPLPYAGAQWRVDDPAPGQVTITVRLASLGNVEASIRRVEQVEAPAPGIANKRSSGVSSLDSTVFTLPAKTDGLYAVTLFLGAAPLTTLYIPVLRAELLALREQIRNEAVALNDRFAPAREQYLPRLARLAAIESAARTGALPLAQALLDSLARLPRPTAPIHLYPFGNG